MKEVTHIPHQHIEKMGGYTEGKIVILTKEPLTTTQNVYTTADDIRVDETGIHGKFIKVS